MYRRPKFLEILLEIRQEMAREADYDVDLFSELVRAGDRLKGHGVHTMAEESNNAVKKETGPAPRKRRPVSLK